MNGWWRTHLREHFGLESALELQYERHYLRFLMPTVRGAEEGSKKRYAGLYWTRPEKYDKMDTKGIEVGIARIPSQAGG